MSINDEVTPNMDLLNDEATPKMEILDDETKSNSVFHEDKGEDICSICLSFWKSPRKLPCNHIFCRSCLQDYAEKEECQDSDDLNCPLCRSEFTVPLKGITDLPIDFGAKTEDSDEDGDNDEDDDNKFKTIMTLTELKTSRPKYHDDDGAGRYNNDDNNDENSDEKDKCNENKATPCTVCDYDMVAQYQCCQCNKIMCKRCKKCHDIFHSAHIIFELDPPLPKLDYCELHPTASLGYYCQDCDKVFCRECIHDDKHLDHQTMLLKHHILELQKTFQNYFEKVQEKLEHFDNSSAVFISTQESEVKQFSSKIRNLGTEIETDFKYACRFEREKHVSDKTIINSLNAALRRIKRLIGKKTYKSAEFLSYLHHEKSKIDTHEIFFLQRDIESISNEELGKLHCQIGRMFKFDLKENSNKPIFFGNIHWQISREFTDIDNFQSNEDGNTVLTLKQFTDNDSCRQPSFSLFEYELPRDELPPDDECLTITLKPFIQPIDTQLIESVNVDITMYLLLENGTMTKEFNQTFKSSNDKLSWQAQCVRPDKSKTYYAKFLFEVKDLKRRSQVL